MKTKVLGATLLVSIALIVGCSAPQKNPGNGTLGHDKELNVAFVPTPLENPKNGTLEPDKEPDVIFLPTPHDVVDMMLHLARVGKDDLVYDLGCGDGRIVVSAAKKYGCKAVGYDIDRKLVKESQQSISKNKIQHLARVEHKDIFTLDLSKASVVTLYLLPELNVRLIPQLEKLAPGSRIISHDFDMKGIDPDVTLTMKSAQDGCDHEIYLWTTPLRKVTSDEDEEEETFMEEFEEEKTQVQSP